MQAEILITAAPNRPAPIDPPARLPYALSFGLLIALIILGVIHWRSRQSAQMIQSQLQQDLETLKQESQTIQQHLQTELDQTKATLQSTRRVNADLETQNEALKHQCSRLRDSLDQQSQQVRQDTQTLMFEQIQTLLTQYPTLRQMATSKPDLPARNLVAALTPLDNLLQFWGYVPIGTPWEALAYDPQLHQGDVGDLQVGETVYVRFVGYREAKTHRILIPAKVSRTLPGGVSP